MANLIITGDHKEFWNKRASSFPRYSPGDDNYEARVLKLARANGVDFFGKRILDVGCGSGMFTIRLAQEASVVQAVDISDAMLAALQEDASSLNVTNIVTQNYDWLDFEVNSDFDVVFCSMTPSLMTEAGSEKVLAISGATVVYLGYNGLHRSEALSQLFEIYNITPKAWDNAIQMRSWLLERGIKIQTSPIEGAWRVNLTKEELINNCLCALAHNGIEPESVDLDKFVERFRQDDGQYLEVTDYKIEMIIWQNS